MGHTHNNHRPYNKTSTPLERWTKFIDVMTEKDRGQPKIHRLRGIVKYEANYNMLLKLNWPRLTTRYAKRRNTSGKNQLGTRPKTISNDTCIINELLLERSKIQHTTLLINQNNASACYWRSIICMFIHCCCSIIFKLPFNDVKDALSIL